MRDWTRREVLKQGFLSLAGFRAVLHSWPGSHDAPFTKGRAAAADVMVAGDLLGRLAVSCSQQEGADPLVGATLTVTGRTPVAAWTRTATTDANGFAFVEFPFGSIGTVTLAGTHAQGSFAGTIDSSDVAVGLTPRPADPAGRVSLDGEWQFAVDPLPTADAATAVLTPRAAPVRPAIWASITVPANWEMAGFRAETGVAAYRRSATFPAAWKGKRIKLRAEGIYSQAEVWCNDKRVGSHDGGGTAFELDLTDAARVGAANVIDVLVREASDAGNLDGMSYYAHFGLGGIWRPIEVFAVEPAHVARLAVSTKFDAAYQDATLHVEVDVVNESTTAINDAALAVQCVGPDGKAIAVDRLAAKVSLASWERKRVALAAPVSRPEQWNAERPRLYTLTATLDAPSQARGATTQRIGFAQVEIKGRTYLFNGKPVKMWGACHHDAHPLMGRAIDAATARHDIQLMKGANLNALRTSHYPPHPAVMDAADELGMYVEDEAPFAFVSVGYGPQLGRTRDLTSDLRLLPKVVQQISATIERDRNHPSVAIWSVCNESAFGRNFQFADTLVRELDPTRPTSAGQSANLQIATYHNPTSMGRIEETADFQTPVLYDEAFAIFQSLGPQAQAMELDPGLRDFWATAHPEPIQAITKTEHQLGAQIWAWVDDTFLIPGRGIEQGRSGGMTTPREPLRIYAMAGRGIVGDPMWGIIDGWRRPRPEWWLSKKLFSPIRIAEAPLAPAAKIRVPVDNWNHFVDLDQYVCRWKLGQETGEMRASVPPQARGEIVIAPRTAPAPDSVLTLEFVDETGRVVDGFKLPFRPRAAIALPWSGKPARILEEEGRLDFGSYVRLVGPQHELTFDRASGILARGLARKQPVLLGGPKLHLLRTQAVLAPYPTGWSRTDDKSATEKGAAVLYWNGAFGEEFRGGYVVRMDDAGNLEIEYAFTCNGEGADVREIGLAFEMPLQFDRLTWERRAEWSYYPDDHIGRPSGTAVAHPAVPQQAPPKDRPYAQDDYWMGCNDFRSVKRGVYMASLTNAAGQGVRVVSDGTQHVRATVGPDAIELKVLDYYGGSPTGYGEWDGAAYDNGRRVASGEVLKGKVRLQLL